MEKILELEESKKKLIINIDDKLKTKKYKKLTELKFNSKWAYAAYISFAIVIVMCISLAFYICSHLNFSGTYSIIMFLGFYGLILLFSVLSVIFINKDSSVFSTNLYNQDVDDLGVAHS